MAVLRVKDKYGNTVEIPALRGEKGDKGEDGITPVVDQTYNPESSNAQSGKAVAEAIASLGNGDVFVTVADITVKEAVNAITIDENSFSDITKLKDFYVAFSIAKPETVQSGKLMVKGILSNSTPALAVITTWNHASYVMKGNFYSKCFDDHFRFNVSASALGANGLTGIGLTTTIAQTAQPLKGLIINCDTAASVIPVGSKIVIKGILGR